MSQWQNEPPPPPAIPPIQPPNQLIGGSTIHEGVGGGIDGALSVNGMTDEQLEVLRTQIAAYAAITEQLAELHKVATSQQDVSGMGVGNLYTDPMVPSASKYCPRQRWIPTSVQLQILERIFVKGIGTPNREKIREIVAECCQYGQITETNVYNWFQNRRARARSRQKQLNALGPNNSDQSEAGTDPKSPKEKTTKEMNSETHSTNPQPALIPSDECAKASEGFGAFYESLMDQSRIDQFMGKTAGKL